MALTLGDDRPLRASQSGCRELSADELVDRKEELQAVVADMTEGSKLFLIGPRRYGKTSILKAAGEIAQRDHRAVILRYNVEGFPTLDLLVERVLMTFYLGESQTARDCAKKFISVILTGGVAADWDEVRRLANLPEYRNLSQCVQLVKEVADELKIKSPLHPD